MTVKDLRDKLDNYSDDDIVILTDPGSLSLCDKTGDWVELMVFGK